jgi:LysR family transcriptional regulator, transcriptional activator for dmlA
MLRDLKDLGVLLELKRRGSLVAASAALSISPAQASKRLASLEAQLGVQLAHRTTRRIMLTPAAERLIGPAHAVQASLQALSDAAHDTEGDLTGALRVHCTFGFGHRFVGPVLSTLKRRYPALQVQLETSDVPVDPVNAQLDCSVRIGAAREAGVRTRVLAPHARALVASPRYLREHGEPAGVRDLAAHVCLVIRQDLTPFNVWEMQSASGRQTVRVTPAMQSNHGETVLDWCLAGHGIALRSLWQAAPLIARGKLVRLLPRWSQRADVTLIYAERLAENARVAAFAQLLQEQLAGHNWL